MSLNIKEDTDLVLGRKYYVSYINDDGVHGNFENILTNVDGTYFWFSSKEHGLALIRQDMVTMMGTPDKPKDITVNEIATITYNGESKEELNSLIKFASAQNSIVQIYVPNKYTDMFNWKIADGQANTKTNVKVIEYCGCPVILSTE